MKFSEKLNKYYPVGHSPKGELKAFSWGAAISLIWSFGYINNFRGCLSRLYEYNPYTKEKILIQGAVMPDFGSVLGNSLIGFFITAAIMLILTAVHYEWHKTGSKSIYTMKRLPQKGEFLKRCATLPLATAAISILTAMLLKLIYFAVYIAFTPKQCLPYIIFIS